VSPDAPVRPGGSALTARSLGGAQFTQTPPSLIYTVSQCR